MYASPGLLKVGTRRPATAVIFSMVVLMFSSRASVASCARTCACILKSSRFAVSNHETNWNRVGGVPSRLKRTGQDGPALVITSNTSAPTSDGVMHASGCAPAASCILPNCQYTCASSVKSPSLSMASIPPVLTLSGGPAFASSCMDSNACVDSACPDSGPRPSEDRPTAASSLAHLRGLGHSKSAARSTQSTAYCVRLARRDAHAPSTPAIPQERSGVSRGLGKKCGLWASTLF